MGRPDPRSRRVMALRSIREALSAFLDKRDAGEHLHLTRLWDHWEMVMGKHLAALGAPLGHRKGTLLIAAEDPMAAQDLAMQAQEILERVNAFMDGPFFSRIQIELGMGRSNLAKPSTLRPPPPETRPPRPEHLGGLMGSFDPASPVGRSYEAYVRYFSRIHNTL